MRRTAPALALVGIAAATGRAQEYARCTTSDSVVAAASPTLTAVRTPRAPHLTGRADDPVWRAAPVVSDFRDFAPRPGGESSVRTEARVLYDDRALYVQVRAFDPHPEQIVRRLARRDTPDGTADQVLVFLDPYHDRRSGYEFVVTAAGVQSDALLANDGDEDFSWDGVWDAATSVDALGWVAEFAIPLRQLRFADRHAPTFGIMIGRWIGRSGERMSVPQYQRALPGLVSQFGSLGGLRDLARSGGLEVTPYVMGQTRNVRAPGGRTGRLDTHPSAGGDVRWLPRPNVSVDATVNPDFGQVEADPAVLNLTGVEVFQTERRPFFLDGAGLLTLPLASDGSAELFDSRRIGRRPALADAYSGPDATAQTTIEGAAKVTARLTPTTSATALAAVTGREQGIDRPGGSAPYTIEPRARYAVARVQRDFRAGRSGIGLMATHVDRDVRDSVVGALLPSGADALAITTQHQTTDGAYQLSAWGAASAVRGHADAIARLQLSPVHAFQSPDAAARLDPDRTALHGSAASVSLGKVGGGVTRFGTAYRWIAPGFDVNELGFLTTSGVQRWTASAGLNVAHPGAVAGVPFRRADVTLGFLGDWSTTGLAYRRGLTLTGNMQLNNLAQVQASVGQQLPGAYCAVACTRGGAALLAPSQSTAALDLTGDPRRAWVPHANAQWNRDDVGRAQGLSGQADVVWRVRSNVDASLAAYAADTHSDWAYYGTYGAAASDTTHYTVAALRQPTRSLTGRVNYTVARTLTLQWYGQAYISRGAYTDVRELADPRARDWARRFRPYSDSSVTAAPGGIDYKQFRSNAVLRWEYRPGSTLVLVWTQGRDVEGTAPATPGLWAGQDFRNLFALHPTNSVAIKASYWLSR